ncbi:MAG: hypothetical protein MJ078_01110 [Clostridia bacterium]|nr:hypothetical protein [Clostridia bacterium]
MIEKEQAAHGVFYTVKAKKKDSVIPALLPVEEEIEAFLASYRYKQPFFMRAKTGTSLSKVPLETQFLALKHKIGRYSVWYSVVKDACRTSFYGNDDG